MTLPPLQLVLFDLDGTLIETSGEIADAVNDTLIGSGLAAVSQAQVDAWIGHGTQVLLVKALAHRWQIPEAAVRDQPGWSAAQELFASCYLQRCGTRSTLYPYVREVLDTLTAKGVARALVTNKEALYTQAILKAHRLDDCFDYCISGDTLPQRKPDPAGVLWCMEQAGVQADAALFVGDSSIDAQTAHNAGVRVWLLPYGYNQGAPLQDARPDRVIQDVRDILGRLP